MNEKDSIETDSRIYGKCIWYFRKGVITLSTATYRNRMSSCGRELMTDPYIKWIAASAYSAFWRTAGAYHDSWHW